MNSADLQYYRKINGISEKQSYKDLLINEMTQEYNIARKNAIYRFDVLINSTDGKDIYINDSTTAIRGVIDTSKKQTADTEMEETIQVYPNQIKRGDYIKFKMNDTDELRTYLIKSKIDKKHGYDEAVFEECNYLFKWMSDGIYHEAWGIGTDQTKYTLGVSAQSSAGILEADARYSILFPNDSICKSVGVGTRFLFNDGAWKVTKIEYVSSSDNIRSLLLGQDSINYEVDDVDNEIADAKSYLYSITLNSTSETLVETSTYQIVPTVTNNGVLVSNPTITYSSSDTNIATVNENGLVTTVSVGNAIITASIGSVTATLDLVVTAKTVESIVTYGVEWSSTGTTLKTYVASTAQCNKYINGVKQDGLVISYEIDSVGQSLVSAGKIAITQPSSSSVQIRNKSVSSTTTFTIIIKDSSDGTVITNQVITLTNGI